MEEDDKRNQPPPGTSGGFGHLSNLKFKSFENAAERREMVLGGKQIFTISLIHAKERLIDVVHRRALSFFREKHGHPGNAAPLPPPVQHNGICVPDALHLRT